MSATAATAAPATDSNTGALSLMTQVSAAAALIVFVRDLWMLSPLDHALLSAIGVGLGAYLALVCGYLTVKRILDAPAAADEEEDAPASPAVDPVEAEKPAPVSEPVAA